MEAFSPHFDYPTYSQGLFNPSTTPSIDCIINQKCISSLTGQKVTPLPKKTIWLKQEVSV